MAQKEKRPVSVVLIGISGMGQTYLETLLAGFPPGEIDLLGVVDPQAERCPYRNELRDRDVPVFGSLAAVYESLPVPELAVICSPIHHHVSQITFALEKGSCVLCEKPIGSTIQDAERLIKIGQRPDLWVMIGYQWSYSRAIQSLKLDIMNGVYGKPLRAKALCCWPRDAAYYTRNDWAGRIRSEEGNWILDSPANNAMAHFLHNLFYLLGDRVDVCAMPSEVKAELYRTYRIENYDTVACRTLTRDGTELLFIASHSTSRDSGPMFSFDFEKASVSFGEAIDDILARDPAGRKKRYGSPEAEHPLLKLFAAVETVRKTKTILCGPEASIAQTLCMNGIQESAPAILDFPDSKIISEPEFNRSWAQDLLQELGDCYDRGMLPSEAGLSWARPGKDVDLRNYHYFPGGKIP